MVPLNYGAVCLSPSRGEEEERIVCFARVSKLGRERDRTRPGGLLGKRDSGDCLSSKEEFHSGTILNLLRSEAFWQHRQTKARKMFFTMMPRFGAPVELSWGL